MSHTICYEQPLNERVRTLLRMEYLFRQIHHALSGNSTWDSRSALQALFDLLALTGRNELKSELLKELERHTVALNRLRQNPGIDIIRLNQTLDEISAACSRIHHFDSLSLEAVRQSDFLCAIHKRSQVPDGTCRFDLPALYHWLQQDNAVRSRHLNEWLAPFAPMREAVFLALRLIRDSATLRPEIALGSFFQRALDAGAPHQMIRVLLPASSTLFPEISGGRHRFTIRFLTQPDPNRRAVQSTADVAFELACCTI